MFICTCTCQEAFYYQTNTLPPLIPDIFLSLFLVIPSHALLISPCPTIQASYLDILGNHRQHLGYQLNHVTFS